MKLEAKPTPEEKKMAPVTAVTRRRARWFASRGGREAILGFALAGPWIIRLVVLGVYPILAAFYYSFTHTPSR